MKKSTVIILIISSVTFFYVLACGLFLKPPKFYAQAHFTINWNKIPHDDQNSKNEFTQQAFEKNLSNLQLSDQFVSALAQACNIPNEQTDSLVEKLHRNLHVRKIGAEEDSTLYLIGFADNNREVALNCVNILSSRIVEKINIRAKQNGTTQALKSYFDNAEAQNKEKELREELAVLSRKQNQDYSVERASRIEEIENKLNSNDTDKVTSGFQTLIGIAAIFSNPATEQQDGIVAINRSAKSNPVLLRAVFYAFCVGAIGFFTKKIWFRPPKSVPPRLRVPPVLH